MKEKVAVAYIRVSTKSEAQLHSFEYQANYWQNAITASAEYKFGGIYADEGISGKSLSKRPQLKKLLTDGQAHKFDAVFCKSVSRFGRNTIELLENVRLLRDCGVRVFFEKENIDTFDPSAETMLTLAASIAENDLQIYSDNMRWSLLNRHKNGWVSVGCGILGYKMNTENNTLEIIPEEAETVKRIFELYLYEKLSPRRIGEMLEKEGRKNKYGKAQWVRGTIEYILRNEKYKGCSLSQKTITTFRATRINKDELPKFYVENSHEAIISPEVFDKVQEELKSRESTRPQGQVRQQYAFTHKVVCGVCNHGYAHKLGNSGKRWQTEIWVCANQNLYGKSVCDNHRIKDSVLKEKFVECYNEFILQNRVSDETVAIRKALSELIDAERELKAMQVNRLISPDAYREEYALLRKDIDSLSAKLADRTIRGITKSDYATIEEFDEEKVKMFIDKVTITHSVVTFLFINGAKISREYSNGKSGNKVGWYDMYLQRLAGTTGGNQ